MNPPTAPKLAVQAPVPRDRRAVHSFRPTDKNVTVPVGVPTDDLTLAESLTRAPTHARLGLTETVVVVGCLTELAAVAALAGRAHSAQVAVATAVTDTSRTSLMQIPPHSTRIGCKTGRGQTHRPRFRE
jgi:hypothetical protein